MRDFNILYIEHSSERVAFAQAMRNVPATVTILSTPDTDELKKILMTKHFDLVVTDTFFLAENEEHDEEEEKEDTYKLDKIVAAIREIENKRVKIAVHTHFSEYLLTKKEDDLLKVDYIWDKLSSPQNFIYWQVKRIKEDILRTLPDHALINSLHGLLIDDGTPHLPWRKDLLLMIENYRNHEGEMEQVEAIRFNLKEIATKCDFFTPFDSLFESIVEAERFNIAGNSNAWGHLRHAINVFWLGYYILNSGFVDMEKLARTIFKNSEDMSLPDAVKNVNEAWLLASCFHDCGLLGQRLADLTDSCNKITSVYEKIDLALTVPQDWYAAYDIFRSELDNILSLMGSGLGVWFGKCRSSLESEKKLDHGLLSSVVISKKFAEPARKASEVAAAAVALHNIAGRYADSAFSKNVGFAEHPLGCLLILCDQIEVWDRQTGHETSFRDLPIECGELREIRIDKDNGVIELTINYVPFRYIDPSDHEMMKLHRKLYDILKKKVFGVLDFLKFSEVFNFKLNIQFLLNGRKKIAGWDSVTGGYCVE